MLRKQELDCAAGRAGFHTKIVESFDPTAWPGDRADCINSSLSVCVAAPAYDCVERYLPFNYRQGDRRSLIELNSRLLRDAASALSPGGLMFVYGLPAHLSHYCAALIEGLTFKYWIAIRTLTSGKEFGLRPEQTGLLLMSKPGASISRIRIPHARCRCCGETLKDWGGKSHLMHPGGVALSDVWMDLVVDPEDRMPPEVFERILRLSSDTASGDLLLLAPDHTPAARHVQPDQYTVSAFNPLRWRNPAPDSSRDHYVPEGLVNNLHRSPCLEVLKAIPSETVDLAFADPPFNLTKDYNGYSDDRNDSDYIGWCKRWLVEYQRVLKPGGAMFILNLPKWSARLADFLSRTNDLFLQSWVAWASLPEPKGVLMPAHYSLLYFTKGERAARFNYCSMENGWEPFDEAVFPPDRADVCQRRSCVRRRRASAHLWRGELTDIWYDIHRVRRSARAASAPKTHPCETPERLIDRILRLATNPGDLVLDAFAGVGTSAVVARRLGRRFIAIEQDEAYLQAAAHRMSEQHAARRQPRGLIKRGHISRRKLQIELGRLAVALGRLPTKTDVELLSKYDLEAFENAFTSWSTALKAARVSLCSVSAQIETFESTAPTASSRAPDGEPASTDFRIN